MANEIRFDGKVAIVTGAGNGLGKAHALLLAARGARVVVNDLGGSATGDGASSKAADLVVEEIRAAGGEAVPNYDSVVDGEKIVQTALDSFGRIDIVINNAGILRDTTFHKMTEGDWDIIYKVHVLGAFKVTHAAWPHMREQGYGRIVMTASAAGIYGNFGQANYAMAKLGLTGFSNTLALEGVRKNIHVNTIAPLAGSRLTETILPQDITDALKPELVSPLVAWLCHENCEETGGLYEVGGGFFAKLRWERAPGKMYRLGREVTPETVIDAWGDIAGFDKDTVHPGSVAESMGPIMANLNAGPSGGGNKWIDVDEALGWEAPPLTSSYDEKDLALYALGVGAGSDPLNMDELALVYEMHGDGFKALPTFGVIPSINAVLEMASQGIQAPGLNYGLDKVLHGEQYTELKRPLPRKATLTNKTRIKEIWDKGKGAVVVSETKSYDEDGDELIHNDMSVFVRGAGGWGGDRGPSVKINVPPEREPDAVVEERVAPGQALLYRLSGDWNPLHADPSFAKNFGFEKPILHGLCTFGHVGRHVISSFCGGDPRYFKSIRVRFAQTVFPGETLVTEMWKESATKIVLRCSVKERGEPVITNAAVELWEAIPAPKAKAAPKKAATAAAAPAEVGPGDVTSGDVFVAIGQYCTAKPEMAAKIKTVYQFKLTGPDSVWTLDLKDGGGATAPGEAAPAGCTLELTDADFLGMCSGELDSMQLFTTGKLKISGDLMASQKLEFLKKIDPESVLAAARERLGAGGGGAAAPAEVGPGDVTSADVFVAIGEFCQAKPDMAAKIKTVYQFKITEPDSVWTLDLKDGGGATGAGETVPAGCTLELTEANFLGMCSGELDSMQLFTTGKLKISGDLMASQKLEFLKKIDPESVLAAARERLGAGGGGGAPAAAAPRAEPGSADVFVGMGVYVERHPELVAKVGKTYLFNLKGPDSTWKLDLANAPSGVTEGGDSADCTLELTNADFMDMATGKADPMLLFTTGKLKISGDLMASQKLDFMTKIDPAEIKDEVAARMAARAAAGPAKAAPTKAATAVAPGLFDALASKLAATPDLGADVGAVVQFLISSPDAEWYVDLSASPGAVHAGRAPEAGAILALDDGDLSALAESADGARDLFQRGRLRVEGDFSVARNLGFLQNLA